MAKFLRSPAFVEAVQFNPDVKPWPDGVGLIPPHWTDREGKDPLRYNFLSGDMGSGGGRIVPGDWIVTNPTGERYIVRKKVFSSMYEEVK